MNSLNSFSFTGRAARDADIRYFDDGRSVATVVVAVNLRPRRGEEQPPLWVEASLWGKRAQAIADHVKKGDLLAVVGELQLPDAYIDKAGNARVRMKLNANEISFLGGGRRDQSEADPVGQQPQQPRGAQAWASQDLPF